MMEKQKYIFKWGGLRNENTVFKFSSFSVYYSNPFPKIFKAFCWWRFTGFKIKHLHVFGFHFVGFREGK
jgi:hypothetical protein